MKYINKKEEYIKLLSERLLPDRFRHSLNVADSALELAKIFGADEDKAYIAGLLHDCTKNENTETRLQFFENNGIILTDVEKANKKLWHAMTAPLFAKNVLGIDDEEILLAMRYHTTGRANMSLLEKIIYIADYISKERDFPDVEVMRALARESLEKAALFSLRFTLSSICAKEKVIHPDCLEFYNRLIIDGIKI